MDTKRKKYHSAPCDDSDHCYIELSKPVTWKGKRFVVIYCNKCADTQLVGSLDTDAQEEV